MWAVVLVVCVCVGGVDDDILTPTGYSPPQHSSRHGPQRTQHTASTAATPRYPQGRRQNPCRVLFSVGVCFCEVCLDDRRQQISTTLTRFLDSWRSCRSCRPKRGRNLVSVVLICCPLWYRPATTLAQCDLVILLQSSWLQLQVGDSLRGWAYVSNY